MKPEFFFFVGCVLMVILLILFGGCAQPRIITEYKYIDRNCSAPEIAPIAMPKPRFIAIDINETRFYCASEGASLLILLEETKK
ncbi:MAG: hypothetical protein LBU73_07970 [Helicobacteraceae bacterium]|jgi:hypothetical protein|nr:hypothetical protein [Helicobacteraceae bacterium]